VAAGFGPAEMAVTLFHLDSAFSDHLVLVAELRDGSPLERLGGRDPLQHFKVETSRAFLRLERAVDEAVIAAFADVTVRDGALDPTRVPIQGPSATWTHLINDDPFRKQLGMMLTGPGRTTMAIAAAAAQPPLMALWCSSIVCS